MIITLLVIIAIEEPRARLLDDVDGIQFTDRNYEQRNNDETVLAVRATLRKPVQQMRNKRTDEFLHPKFASFSTSFQSHSLFVIK